MQFELFEKHTATKYYQIEREKSWLVFDNVHNKIAEQVPVREWCMRIHATETRQQV